jgi:2-(1,2-epoxy-1,2-dihydrophenyl)acetyl-CoA isomerase
MTEFTTLSLDFQGPVATLTLRRPKAGNAMGALSGQELRAAADIVARDTTARVLVLRAEGRAFCVGGDLAEFSSHAELGPAVRAMVVDFHTACQQLAELDLPILAVVQGPVAGAGLALTSLADYVVAASEATFTYAYASVGLSADGGVTWLLPKQMGLRAFRSFVITGRTLTSEEGLAQGLVSELVAGANLEEKAEALTSQFARGPTRALGAIRRLTLDGYGRSYADHLSAEMDQVATLADTDAAKGAIADVLSRRAPQFPNR